MMYWCLLPFECYFSSGILIPGRAWRFSLLFFFLNILSIRREMELFRVVQTRFLFISLFSQQPPKNRKGEKQERKHNFAILSSFPALLAPVLITWKDILFCCNSLSCTVYACLLFCVIFEREKEARGKERLRKHTDLIFLCIYNSYVCGWRKSRPFFSPHLWMGGRISPYCMYIYAGTWKNRIANKIQKGTL